MNIYVTEPEVIDLTELRECFSQGEPVELFEGSSSFDGSSEKNFEVLIIRSGTYIDSDIKTYFPYIKAIIRIGTGLDNVDLEYCKKESIHVYNAAGANADAVSEYVVAVILFSLRRLYLLEEADLLSWNRFKFTGKSLRGQTVGLIGFGNIGRILFEKLKGFQCKEFLVYDPYISSADLPDGAKAVGTVEDIISNSTIVSIHVPLTEQTKNIINEARLCLLKEGTLLINASRGGIVDEEAIIKLAETGFDFVYAADTVVDEPNCNKKLLNHRNIIITPHIASLTEESERSMISTAVQNFLAHKWLV